MQLLSEEVAEWPVCTNEKGGMGPHTEQTLSQDPSRGGRGGGWLLGAGKDAGSQQLAQVSGPGAQLPCPGHCQGPLGKGLWRLGWPWEGELVLESSEHAPEGSHLPSLCSCAVGSHARSSHHLNGQHIVLS